MGAKKIRAQLLRDTANWRSIKNEENKAPMEPAYETENLIYFKCMYILHACIYFQCIQTHTYTQYRYLYVQIKCVYTQTHRHTHIHIPEEATLAQIKITYKPVGPPQFILEILEVIHSLLNVCNTNILPATKYMICLLFRLFTGVIVPHLIVLSRVIVFSLPQQNSYCALGILLNTKEKTKHQSLERQNISLSVFFPKCGHYYI